MKEEFIRVINLVKDGKLTPEQAAELIETMVSKISVEERQANQSSRKKLIKMEIRSEKGDNIDIQLPLKMSKLLTLSLAVFKEKIPDIDLNLISKQVEEALEHLESLQDDIINIASADGTTVRVFVE